MELNPANLPSSDNFIFRDSSFFTKYGAHAKLPTPAMVRKEAGNPKTLPGRWARKPWAVPFPSMKLLVKYGPTFSTAEGQCLHAIRTNLGQQVPVPEVYGWCWDSGEAFIYMQLIEGHAIEDVWDTLTQTDHIALRRQLRQIVRSLRLLRQPLINSFVGNIACQPLRDHYFEGCQRPAGPFPSVQDFNNYLIHLFWEEPTKPPPASAHPRRSGLPDEQPVFFTHADLTGSNILVSTQSGKVTIVAIIDWHQSGWYPAYWEVSKSIS